MKPCLLWVLLSLALLAVSGTPHTAAADDTIAAWVQYTAEGIEARAVTRGECPTAEIDGRSVAMSVRAAPNEAHPATACAVALPKRVEALSVDGRPLPVPNDRPRRIVVMGDTGCRLSDKHGLYQECNNDSLWPFAHVAKAVAAAEPDLIVYTGDYIYRESPCPAGNKGCEGSPYGDTLATWMADWLVPAAPVHQAAPIVLIRGNHETCSRAGKGWFRYLDAHPLTSECSDNTKPWVVTLRKLQIGVLDVANLESDDGKPLDLLFAGQLEWLDKQLDEPSWLTAHRTFWGYGADDDTGELTTPTEILQDAVRVAGLPEQTDLLVGAHIHLAEILDFAGDRPPQLVVANSGTQLVPRVDPPAAIDGVDIELERTFYQYGFVVMDADGARKWRVRFRDVEGRNIETCKLEKKRVHCKP